MATAVLRVRDLSGVGTLVDLVKGMPRTDPRYALFLGAGASVSSGIPGCATLVRRWKQRVFLDLLGEERITTGLRFAFSEWVGGTLAPEHKSLAEAALRGRCPGTFADWSKERQRSYGHHSSDYSLLFQR